VGALASTVFFSKIEMTLDHSTLLAATKGHFCSFLVSNIFCYPLFLLIFSPFGNLILVQNTHKLLSLLFENSSARLLPVFLGDPDLPG